MKSLLAPVALGAALIAAPALAEELAAEAPVDVEVEGPDDLRLHPPLADTCRDRIQTVREERGLPLLPDRRANQRDEALLVYAVDHRVDDCSVMLVAGSPYDVRPLPEPRDGPVRVEPLQ